MNQLPAPGGLGRGAMNGGAIVGALKVQHAQKLQQNWIQQGWQKEVTVSDRINNIVQL